MKVKALKMYDLGGVIRKVGDEFEVSEIIGKQLVSLNQAEIIAEQEATPTPPKRRPAAPKE